MTFKLDDQQRAIVEAPFDKAMRVFAGPGAGKTATLVGRIDYMLRNGVSPEEITAVSFSKVAATELGDRIVKLNDTVDLSRICTIHALAYRGLKRYGDSRNVASGGKGYFVKKFAEEAIEYAVMPEVGWKDFMSYVNHTKARGVRKERLAAHYSDLIANMGGITKYVPWMDDAHNRMAAAHNKFDLLMRASGLLTFADMLCEFEWLLTDDPSELAFHRQTTNYLFIDEAQDTNPQAMRILYMLAHPQDNVCVIGDPDQGIYGFIGANADSNMQSGFEERFPEHTTFMLETNYRSTERIVSFVDVVIDGNYGEHNEEYRKTLVPRNDAEEGADVTYTTYPTVNEEAKDIAESIEKGIWENDREPGDYFVLARVRAYLPYIYSHLFAKKIPFVDRCGGSFWDMAHVQDLLGYMRLSVDKNDDVAFQRIYNKASNRMVQPFDKKNKETGRISRAKGDPVHHRWLGKAFLGECEGSWYGMASVYKRTWQAGMDDIRDFMTGLDDVEGAEEKATFIIDNCLRNYWAMAEGGSEGGNESGRVPDLMTVADMATDYDTTEDFLAYVKDMQDKVAKVVEGDESKVVILSTIHRVKGAERTIVHLMGLMDGVLPHAYSMHKKDGSPVFDNGSILPFSQGGSIEDERRLFFVASSRAKEELHCTGAFMYLNRSMSKSMFAYETNMIEEDLVDDTLEEMGIVIGDD